MPARKWPKRRNAVLHKIHRTAERQRRDDISLGQGGSAGNPIGGGGDPIGALGWLPLTDIFTPATGVRVQSNAMYAYNDAFFYLRGNVDIGYAPPTTLPDASLHPSYQIGNFEFPLVGPVASPPAPLDSDPLVSWVVPVAIAQGPSGADIAGLLGFSVQVNAGPLPVALILGPDGPSISSLANARGLCMDGVAVPW